MTAPAVLVMGVTGAGKSTVGAELARVLGWSFVDGDDLHPPSNIAKLTAGVALTDADRAPWLSRIGAQLDVWATKRVSGVVACSALKRTDRDRLRGLRPQVELVYLHGERAVLAARLANRRGHFMSPDLLDSQLATLELPSLDEHDIRIEIVLPIEKQTVAILAGLRAHGVDLVPNPGGV